MKPFLSSIVVLIFLAGLKSPAASSTLTQSDFSTLPATLSREYGFIVPNEDRFQLFSPSLQNKSGVMLGVGTFRFFQSASVGSFSHAISLDVDQSVTRFNSGLLDIINRSANRHEFIGRLFGNMDAIDVLKKYEVGSISRDLAVSTLEKYIGDFQTVNLRNNSTIQDYFPKSVAPEDLKAFSRALVQFIAEKDTYQSSFLGSDSLFANLKSLASDQRIILINGDLMNEEQMRYIGNKLRSHGLEVSVFDISNTHKYIKPESIKQYLRSVAQIPFSSEGVVQMTTYSRKTPGAWDYYSVPISEYLGLKTKKNESFYSFPNRAHPPLGVPCAIEFSALKPL